MQVATGALPWRCAHESARPYRARAAYRREGYDRRKGSRARAARSGPPSGPSAGQAQRRRK